MDRLDPDPQCWSDYRINYQSNSLIIKFLYLYYHSNSRTTARAGQQEQGNSKRRVTAKKGNSKSRATSRAGQQQEEGDSKSRVTERAGRQQELGQSKSRVTARAGQQQGG